MDDDDPVAGEAHVEFEAVGAERQPIVEGRNGVLRTKGRPAPVRVNQRARGVILVEFVNWRIRELVNLAESLAGAPLTIQPLADSPIHRFTNSPISIVRCHM